MVKVATKLEHPSKPVPAPESARVTPFEALHREVDRLFDAFDAGRPWFQRFWEPRVFEFETPVVDVAEKDDTFEIEVELPGMEAKDIDVTVSDGMLAIRGEKSGKKEEKKKRYYLSERHFGSFERMLALPRGVDVEKVSADYKSGVLKITLPKTKEAKAHQRKVEIKAA